MDIKLILLIVIFVNGLIAIAFEHKLEINKSWIALFTGTAMWIVISIGGNPTIMHHSIAEGSAEIFELIVFLIGAGSGYSMIGGIGAGAFGIMLFIYFALVGWLPAWIPVIGFVIAGLIGAGMIRNALVGGN